jgi:hypothetical protein
MSQVLCSHRFVVMAGLGPAIHVFAAHMKVEGMDGRHRAGHDGEDR